MVIKKEAKMDRIKVLIFVGILMYSTQGWSVYGLLLSYPKKVITLSDINLMNTDYFLLAYIDACHSAEGICQAFRSKAALGWKGPVTWYYGWWFEARFWLECLKKITIGEACRIAKYNTDRVTGQKWIPKLFGDTSIILKGEF
jgi:hypothetical protein